MTLYFPLRQIGADEIKKLNQFIEGQLQSNLEDHVPVADPVPRRTKRPILDSLLRMRTKALENSPVSFPILSLLPTPARRLMLPMHSKVVSMRSEMRKSVSECKTVEAQVYALL